MKENLRVTVYDGKYTIIQYDNGQMDILRYKEVWLVNVHDNVILALANEVEEARKAIVGAAEALVEKDHNEAYHQLYKYADPTFTLRTDPFERLRSEVSV